MDSLALWGCLVFFGIAGVFGYQLWVGWQTGIVRFPMSLVVFQEFEREQSPEYFWGIVVLDALGLVAALMAAFLVGWRGL